MARHRTTRRVTELFPAALLLAACGHDLELTQPTEDAFAPGDSSGVIASVRLSTAPAPMTVLGSKDRLLVWARDSADTVVCGKWAQGCASWVLSERFEWEVIPTSVVDLEDEETTLYPNGGARLTALADGRAEVVVSLGEVADTVEVEVAERARIAWSLPLLGSFVGAALGEDGTVYAASSHGLQAVGPDGGERWSVPGRLVRGTPAIAGDGTLYLGAHEGVTALDPNGSTLWVAPVDRVFSTPALGPDGTVYVVDGDGTLHAIDPAGELQWTFNAPGGEGVNRSPPAVAEDGTVYFGSEDHHLYAVAPDGSERWRFETEGIVRSPAIGEDGTVYFANDRVTEWSNTQGRIVLVDSRMFAVWPDGTERWSAPLEGDVWAGPAIDFAGAVYQGTVNDGGLYVFSPDGALLETLPGGAGHSPIVAGDGSVYRSLGAVTAMEPDGTTRWAFEPGNFANPVPAIGLDGTIYAGTHDGEANWLHAFEEIGRNNGGWDAAPWPQDRGDRANSGRARGGP